MLCADQISFRHADRWILQDVSLTLKPGEFTVLMGPNGSGKTTLLKLLSGAHKPEQGSVSFFNQSLYSFTQQHLARRRCVMSQQLQINFPFRVEDIVGMGTYPFPELPPRVTNIILDSVLEKNHLSEMRNRFYHQMSGGEQQRCQFARAMMQWRCSEEIGQKPFVLLLDEPTSAMDMKQQLLTLQQVRSIADQGAVVCAILHDINLASLFADQLVFLSPQGELIKGDAKTVCHPETISQVFDIHSCGLAHPHHDKPMILPRLLD
jgi:iron complex transport system ATP-binding protein